MWLVVIILNSSNIEHFHPCRKFYWIAMFMTNFRLTWKLGEKKKEAGFYQHLIIHKVMEDEKVWCPKFFSSLELYKNTFMLDLKRHKKYRNTGKIGWPLALCLTYLCFLNLLLLRNGTNQLVSKEIFYMTHQNQGLLCSNRLMRIQFQETSQCTVFV